MILVFVVCLFSWSPVFPCILNACDFFSLSFVSLDWQLDVQFNVVYREERGDWDNICTPVSLVENRQLIPGLRGVSDITEERKEV